MSQDRFFGALIGLAVGDALGTTNEFMPPHSIKTPVTTIVGGGKFRLLPGMWTDDTSMALCLAESLIEKNGVFDGLDQQQRYHRWYQDGHLSSTGKCFDVGKTVLKHLLENLKVNREFHTNISDGASGNGALMRLAPVPMLYSLQDSDLFITKSADNSMTTHPSEISRDACRYYASLIVGAIHGATKEELISPLFVPKNLARDYWTVHPLRQEVLNVVQNCEYKTKNPPDINNGAFVIASLEAALWAFHKFDTFEEGALAVTNLGDDSDTVCAIYGQLAGAYYGMEAIPLTWRKEIVLIPLLLTYAEELYHMAQQLAKGETVTQTEKFKEMQTLNAVLEKEYAQIMRKVDPSPRQYKSMTDFDNDIQSFRQTYEQTVVQHVSEEEKQHMWHDFHTRLEKQDREPLSLMVARKSGGGGLGGLFKK